MPCQNAWQNATWPALIWLSGWLHKRMISSGPPANAGEVSAISAMAVTANFDDLVMSQIPDTGDRGGSLKQSS
jgi:hypothetical protein